MELGSADDVCHKACGPSDVERLAHTVAASLLHDQKLTRVCEVESDRPKPDFRSTRHALEVKEVASPAFRSYLSAEERYIGDKRFYPVSELRQTWGVIADLSRAISSLDRAASAPTMKTLVRGLVPLLKRLEATDKSDARLDPLIWPRVASILHGGHCSVIPPGPFEPGVVFVGHGYEHARTTDVEHDVVGFLQGWLDSDFATNLRKSLAFERGIRCAVLVLSIDGPAIAMTRTLQESPGVQPSGPLRLPEEVDALIVVTDADVLDFGLVEGWRRHAVASFCTDRRCELSK